MLAFRQAARHFDVASIQLLFREEFLALEENNEALWVDPGGVNREP